MRPLRVLIVSENISMRMGGEASLPFYYAKLFARSGVDVFLCCHARVEAEVREAFSGLGVRLHFVQDTRAQRLAFKYGSALSYRVRDTLLAQAIHVSTQTRMRQVACELARAGEIDVVFEPAPIAPKGLSFMFDLGVPVVIGPLCGGMNFPPAFSDLDSFVTRQSIWLGRAASQVAHGLVPGKRHADVLLVANELTARSLPAGCRGRVLRLFESGVDLELWNADADASRCSATAEPKVHFVFSGRFVDWKGIQYLVPAFAKAWAEEPRCTLSLIGSGELDGEIRQMISALDVGEAVQVHGWMQRSQAAEVVRAADVFVMPSLRECGGTAILEAMALGKPVITTNWGGPAEYVDASCGILVEPSSRPNFIAGLAEAMVRLARSPELRSELGAGGRQRVQRDYLDWHSKAERMLSVLHEAVASFAAAQATAGRARSVRAVPRVPSIARLGGH